MGAIEIATLGGGCFWCLEAVYQEMAGVLAVESGYMGGEIPAPSYEQVCTGRSGHAEVVQISFDPQQVSYGEILEVFFAIHDPTTRDRQGNDVGPQYRSVIFHHSEEQRSTARQMIRALEEGGAWRAPIVTEVTAAQEFYRAEDYHQNYFRNNPWKPYCQVVVAPKLETFRSRFAGRRKGAAPGA